MLLAILDACPVEAALAYSLTLSAVLFVLTAVHRRRRVRRLAAAQLQLPAQTERKLAPAPPPPPPPSEQKLPPVPPPPGSPHVKFSPPPKKPPPARSIRPVYVISQSSPLPSTADGEVVTSPIAKPPPSQPQPSSPPRTIDDGGAYCPLPHCPRLLRRSHSMREKLSAPSPVTPVPRTQPYGAPYFFPTPDSPAAVDYARSVLEERRGLVAPPPPPEHDMPMPRRRASWLPGRRPRPASFHDADVVAPLSPGVEEVQPRKPTPARRTSLGLFHKRSKLSIS